MARGARGPAERRPREAHSALAQQRRRGRFQPRPGATDTQGEPLCELRGAGKCGREGTGMNSVPGTDLAVSAVGRGSRGEGRRSLVAQSGKGGLVAATGFSPGQGGQQLSPSGYHTQSDHGSHSWARPSPKRGPLQMAGEQGTPRRWPRRREFTRVFPGPSGLWAGVSSESGFFFHQKRTTQVS